MAKSQHKKSTDIIRHHVRYKINKESITATVLGLDDKKYKGELRIAEKIYHDGNFYKVTHIEENAFLYCQGLTGALTIPNGITTIEIGVFDGCTGLTGPLTIPEGVTDIKSSAFSGCSGLTGPLILPESLVTIGCEAFGGCSGFTGPLILPKSLVTIEMWAFRDCSGFTGSLTIPDNVIAIERRAFCGCSGLTGPLTIPETVIYISSEASDEMLLYDKNRTLLNANFSEADEDELQNAWIDEWGVRYSQDRKRLLKAPDDIKSYSIPYGTEVICSSAFLGCEHLENLIIPNTIETIGDLAFVRCYSLLDLKIPDSVTHIGDEAFYDCLYLKKIELSNSIKTIGEYTFGYCQDLDDIRIPASVRYIAAGAFDTCGLKNITLLNPIAKISNKAFDFEFCDTHEEPFERFLIPCGTKEKFLKENSNTYIHNLEEDENIITDDELFKAWEDDCGVKFSADRKRLLKAPENLGSYAIPQGTEIICYEAFAGCDIANIQIPNSVTTIKERAFCHCEQLESIVIPNSVEVIYKEAFMCCKKLTEISLSDSLKTISEWMFYDCNSLIKIKLPQNLIHIEKGAFFKCVSLNKCDIPRYIYYIGVLSFAYCESLTSFTIPKPVKRDWIESVGLENGVFFGCKNLTEIYLPEKMHDLMSYNFPYSRDPFANCPSLKTIYVPAGAKQKILNIFGSKYDQLVVEISKQEQAQEASRHQDSSTQNVEHYESPMVVYKHKLSITGKLMSFFKSLIKKK